MSGLNRVARGVTLCGSLVIVAAMASTVPLKPAAADNDWSNGQWRNSGHGQQHYDRNWYRGGYGGGSYYHGPTYYYVSPPVYYYQPVPVYYPPAPVYGQPSLNLNIVIP